MNIVTTLEKQSKLFWIITGFLLVTVVGLLDFLTGYEIGFSLFYLFPIGLLAWFEGKQLGIWAAVLSAIVWLFADIASGQIYSHPAIYFWNSMIRFGIFIIVTLLLSALKKALEHQTELARTDSLTTAFNARFFYELVQFEIDRFQRYGHPFTVVYVDLDNFKIANDMLGHSVGDKILYAVVAYARGQLRKIDMIARLGGDEFALLLPETDQLAAQGALVRLQAALLNEMRRNNWPVTFSMGALTSITMPKTIDELMRQADDLMYQVKNNGRNGISYSVYED
jgi:diguanylate cyclase (GGDEF)-like protein